MVLWISFSLSLSYWFVLALSIASRGFAKVNNGLSVLSFFFYFSFILHNSTIVAPPHAGAPSWVCMLPVYMCPPLDLGKLRL
ncbi:uncharacterized protein B0I36DRAFT_65541 [Microdochium trichocladiopsis]|uniref:Secreted protein n=1 Tax=Microdochium trichocladiopsis TaxID=1682393 RepID=A0A9P9BUA1_9PEZI|nr:uncharacterized protein B0I36DRAFT_65541 [Microdochium trichocladiopsis]KAH7037406.1 hypothetical protein B0I36DRAFT_65541 [Microdochium trichocladiopsis]